MKLSLLRRHGILGLNARNLLYIKPFNPHKAIALADNKMKTKAYLSARGVPTAKVYAEISSREELREFDFSSLPDECVLKPNYGFGGEGIIILNGRRNGEFLEQGRRPIPTRELFEHIEDILEGRFSVSGHRDSAFFERILKPHECFKPFRPAGLPDVRIVVFNLVPVMAMLRIPTAESSGKANVHLGGIGIGIDLAKGVTTYAAQYNGQIRTLPHGGSPAGITIPYWEELLFIASRIQYLTNVGYLAVDLTIDEEQGPVLLEINARAGLMVQVANLAPLRSRLERVEGLDVRSPEKGVRLAQDLFGDIRTKKALRTHTKPVLGLRETITIQAESLQFDVSAAIRPDQERSFVSQSVIDEIARHAGSRKKESERGSYRVKFTLGGKRIQTLVGIREHADSTVRASIGSRDLRGFFIDPEKRSPVAPLRPALREDVRAIDQALAEADRKLQLLKYLKPINLLQERSQLLEDEEYNPTFLYPPLPLERLDEWEERLEELLPDDSPLGILLNKKRYELHLRIALLKARGHAFQFTATSVALYGSPDASLTGHARRLLDRQIACALPPPASELLTASAAKGLFEEALKQYGLHDWEVVLREAMVSDCAVGGTKIYLRRDTYFSRAHVASLIAHEVETHVLTAENGSAQPFELLRRGCANYLDTQEGLAIRNQGRVLPPFHEKLWAPARSALAVAYGLEHSFAETRRYLVEELGYRREKALSKTIDVKRGIQYTAEPGGFTKGIVYLKGQRAVEQFEEQGGDIARLYVGKVAMEDLPTIEQIPGLKPPLLLPISLQKRGKIDS